ncbi:hypothetical protein [Hyphobacterium sp.]|uniref:hypothetical protein n=1 Tax=Hyphobacterium sp. TaxID=2004662 RepID=UPI003BA986FD
MILRRLTQHVREQNWLAVALDFLIVVIGVFVGLQVSNWNEARSQRLQAAQFLDDIAADLRADREEIDNTLRAAGVRFSASAIVLERSIDWQSPALIPSVEGDLIPLDVPSHDIDWTAQRAVYNATRFTTFDVERHTYDGLVSSGNILLLSDDALAARLRAHYARVDGFNDVEDQHYRQSVNQVRVEFMNAGIGRLDSIEWEALTAAVGERLELAGALKWVNSDALHQIRALQLLRSDTEALIAAVEGAAP